MPLAALAGGAATATTPETGAVPTAEVDAALVAVPTAAAAPETEADAALATVLMADACFAAYAAGFMGSTCFAMACLAATCFAVARFAAACAGAACLGVYGWANVSSFSPNACLPKVNPFVFCLHLTSEALIAKLLARAIGSVLFFASHDKRRRNLPQRQTP